MYFSLYIILIILFFFDIIFGSPKKREEIIDFIIKEEFKELIHEKEDKKIKKNEKPQMLKTNIQETRKKHTNPKIPTKLVSFTSCLIFCSEIICKTYEIRF